MEYNHHPIIDRPWEFDITEFRYHVGLDGSTPFIDLTLVRGELIRRLRFVQPRDIQIEEGCFPQPTRGMAILDVSDQQLGDLNVHVADFEGTRGALTFWAKDVLDRDAIGRSQQADST
ncbi:MAG: hypothetical protein JKY61_07130, partial [Planctomycetes bacterium]|nr:hypothetical protein [Planctomycetota bacterium]